MVAGILCILKYKSVILFLTTPLKEGEYVVAGILSLS